MEHIQRKKGEKGEPWQEMGMEGKMMGTVEGILLVQMKIQNIGFYVRGEESSKERQHSSLLQGNVHCRGNEIQVEIHSQISYKLCRHNQGPLQIPRIY